MNLNGWACPDPHPAWGACADELLFYTSRYADFTVRRLSELSGGQEIDATGYCASNMTQYQQAFMSQLLSYPPAPRNAQAIGDLMAAVVNGESAVPRSVKKVVGQYQLRPYLQVTPKRPTQSTGLTKVHPIKILRHLSRRYGFSVRVEGYQVWISDARCRRILRSGPARGASNIREALKALTRFNYKVYLDHAHSASAPAIERRQASWR